MTFEQIHSIEDILPDYVYVLRIGDYVVRELSYKSFATRDAKTVNAWIGARLLYRRITEQIYHEEKPKLWSK